MNRRTFIAQAGAALTGAALASARAGMGPNRARREAGNRASGARNRARQSGSHRGLQRARSGPADSLARRQAHRHRRAQSNRNPRNRALARALDSLRHGWLDGGRQPDDRAGRAIPLSLHAAAGRIPLVSHAHFCRARPEARQLIRGQFGCFYIEPKDNAGAYDQEIFLTLHDWNAYMASQRRLLDGSRLRIRDHRRPHARLWRSSQGARGAASAFAYSECERQHGSLAGARGTRNDRGRHGWQSGAHAGPDAAQSAWVPPNASMPSSR